LYKSLPFLFKKLIQYFHQLHDITVSNIALTFFLLYIIVTLSF